MVGPGFYHYAHSKRFSHRFAQMKGIRKRKTFKQIWIWFRVEATLGGFVA
jgi:hypothetical protein